MPRLHYKILSLEVIRCEEGGEKNSGGDAK